MAQTYHHLYDMQVCPVQGWSLQWWTALSPISHRIGRPQCVGLRFFTVYGPRCRRDMAPFKFIDQIYRYVPHPCFLIHLPSAYIFLVLNVCVFEGTHMLTCVCVEQVRACFFWHPQGRDHGEYDCVGSSSVALCVPRGQPIQQFGDGSSQRDYTFVSDIVDGIVRVIDAQHLTGHEIFNLGHGEPVLLSEFIQVVSSPYGWKEKELQEFLLSLILLFFPFTTTTVHPLLLDHGC